MGIVAPFVAGENYITSARTKCIAMINAYFGGGSYVAGMKWKQYHELINKIASVAGLSAIADGNTGQQWLDKMNAVSDWLGEQLLLDAVTPAFRLNAKREIYVADGLATTLQAMVNVQNNSAIRTYLDQNGIWQVAPPNVARIDWSAGYPRGLFEGPATNYIRHAALAGAVLGVVGSGGSLATDMAAPSPVGGDIVSTVVAISTENGLPYLDVRITGQPTTTRYLNFAAGTTIPAVAGDQRTYSMFIRRIAGSVDNVTDLNLTFAEKTAAGSNATGNPATLVNIKPTIDSPSRRVLARTMLAADCAFVLPYLRIPAATTPYDFTLRISMPQAEAGLQVTSPILTNGVVLTRTADLCPLHVSAGAMTAWAFRGYVPSLSVFQQFLGSTGGGYFISGSAGSEASIRLYGTNSGLGFNNILPGAVAFCAGWGASGRRASNAAAAAVEDAVVTDRARTTMYLGPSTGLVAGQVIYLDELVAWVLPDRPSATGVQSQARAAA